MAERFTREERSAIMSLVKSVNTKPEQAVLRLIRLYVVGRVTSQNHHLPGSPDFAITDSKIAIFVHGCFWHQHTCPRGSRKPATNRSYWDEKLAANARRDRRTANRLRALGWRVLTIWECTIGKAATEQRIRRALQGVAPKHSTKWKKIKSLRTE